MYLMTGALLEYAAILCEELSGGDPERYAHLCKHIHEVLRGSTNLCDWLTEAEIQWRIHAAQLRGIQPVIEEQRLKLIDGLGVRVNRILPFDDEYHNTFTKPHEVELRHLVFYKAQLTLSTVEQQLLDQLYEARNDLSHLRVLSEEQITGIAKLAGKWSTVR